MKKRYFRLKGIIPMALLCFLLNGESVRGGVGAGVFKFTETEKYIVNPDMGAVAIAQNKERVVDGSLVLGSFTWKEIEEEKGNCDFLKIEKDNNYSYWTEEKNNKFMFGLSMDVPKLGETFDIEKIDIPKWLYNELKNEGIEKYRRMIRTETDPETRAEFESTLWKIEHDDLILHEFNTEGKKNADIPEVGTFYRYFTEVSGGKEWRCGFSPNYKSPLLIKYHDALLKKLSERYDNEKTYAFVMGSIGHWGEMHTFFVKDSNSPGKYPPREIAEQYEEAYARNFKHVNVSVRYPRKVAKKHNFGLHCHAFGDNMSVYKWHIDFYEKGYTDYATGDCHPDMKEFWKKAPSGGEFLYTGDGRFLRNDKIKDTIKQAEDTRLTWFNELWYGLTEEEKINQELFFSKIGYRLFPEKIYFTKKTKRGRAFKISSKWKNQGTAPFYKSRRIYGILKDGEGKVRLRLPFRKRLSGWMPGETKIFHSRRRISGRLRPGTYRLYIGVFDPKTGKPDINLAVEEKEENGLYFVGETRIVR